MSTMRHPVVRSPVLAFCVGSAWLCLLMELSPALAQTSGRFTFQTIEGGVMRLDSETGQISHCNRNGADYVCRSVADDRAALDDEITRLKRENDILRQQLAGAKTGSAAPKLSLPSEEEIDKAMSLVERMMRRMMRSFQDEAPAPNRL